MHRDASNGKAPESVALPAASLDASAAVLSTPASAAASVAGAGASITDASPGPSVHVNPRSPLAASKLAPGPAPDDELEKQAARTSAPQQPEVASTTRTARFFIIDRSLYLPRGHARAPGASLAAMKATP